MIPIKGGLKYFPLKYLYVQGEAGASFITNKSALGINKIAVLFMLFRRVFYLMLEARITSMQALDLKAIANSMTEEKQIIFWL